MRDIIEAGGLFRHFRNGHLYRVLAVAEHEDELGTFSVTYRSLHDGRTWSRRLESFAAKVERADESACLRFEPEAPFVAQSRSKEFWGLEAQTVRAALSTSNYRYLDKLKELVKRARDGQWKPKKVRTELRHLLEQYAAVDVDHKFAVDIKTGSIVSPECELTPDQKQLLSTEDLIVMLLIRLRLDRRAYTDIDYDQSHAGHDPGGFIEWLDSTLEEMGYTDEWMRKNLLVGGGYQGEDLVRKTYNQIYRRDPLEPAARAKNPKHPGEPDQV